MVAHLILSRRLGFEIAILGYSGEELLLVSSYAVKSHILILAGRQLETRASFDFLLLLVFCNHRSYIHLQMHSFLIFYRLIIVALMLDVVT